MTTASDLVPGMVPLTTEATQQAGPIMDWIVSNTGTLVSGAVNILVIVVLAIIARAIVGRLITHLVRRMASSQERVRNSKGLSKIVTATGSSPNNRQQARAETISSVLRSVASFVIFGVGFVMILGEIGINLGPILASAGLLGLAIGFGAQGLVQDFLSGLFMMIEDQYGVGDVVDVGDAVGTVEEVGLRVTKIRDLNGGLWYVRNGEIMRVCNMNQDWANAVVELPLAYSVDIERAQEVIRASAEEFAQDPDYADKLLEAPDVNGVVGMGNGAMTVRVIAKTQPGEQWALGRALHGRLKQGLDREGIGLAYPMVPTVSP